MKAAQILQSSRCRSTIRLAVYIKTLAANNSLAHPPAIKHQTGKKGLKKKHLARTDKGISMRMFKLLPVSQPVNPGCSTQIKQRQSKSVCLTEKGCNAQKRRKTLNNFCRLRFIIFLL